MRGSVKVSWTCGMNGRVNKGSGCAQGGGKRKWWDWERSTTATDGGVETGGGDGSKTGSAVHHV